MAQNIKSKDLHKLGVTEAKAVALAQSVFNIQLAKLTKKEKVALLQEVVGRPDLFLDHDLLGSFAECLIPEPIEIGEMQSLLDKERPLKIYGIQHIESEAINQMRRALRLPVAHSGALMPDAHLGYGLPIGGVLAAHNAVIPYGVGVDIGCRMALTIFTEPATYLENKRYKLTQYLRDHTRFGANGEFEAPLSSDFIDRPEFESMPLLKRLKGKAYYQLGTSGGGNHFVEFGVATLPEDNRWGLPAGDYTALMSHSGSRGLGAMIANHYTRIAKQQCPLPPSARQLAWLTLDSEAGQEYWLAMNLAGDYAAECHNQIHQRLSVVAGLTPAARIENHHNFAWKELLPNGLEVVVHRKGATPAAKGELGVIPGSMVSPAYIVEGTGEPGSLNSASHGAGRRYSRAEARTNVNPEHFKRALEAHDVTLIGGNIDEAPQVYKNIQHVMLHQQDLVRVLATFHPKIVRMDRQ